MTQELAALQVRLDANTARFDARIQRSDQVFDRAAANIQRNTALMDRGIGRAFSGRNTAAIQQAGFQVGDFAVQVASGQNAIVALTQQGSQLLQFFGPLGSVLGAVGAVLGAVAIGFLEAGDAADDAGKKIKDGFSDIDVGIDGLEQAARAYSDAIEQTSLAQTAASANIVAQTEREFNAKKKLLELELQRARAAQAERDAQRQSLSVESLEGRSFLQQNPELPSRSRRSSARRIRREEAQEALRQAETQLARITAEGELAAVQIERIEEALSLSFEELGARASGGTGGGGASSDSDQFAAGIERLRERIALLREEREGISLSEEALVRYNAQNEAARLERELLNAAAEQDIQLTSEQIQLIEDLALAHETVTIAIDEERRALEERNNELQRATSEQEKLARGLATTSNRLISAAQQADSFSDALRNIGLELLKIGIQTLFGQGPLGGGFSSFIGSPGGGIAGLPFAKGAAFSGGRVVPFANGGVVNVPTSFPMAGGATGLMGEAGPEAIMPLKRGPGGQLGVSGGNSMPPINVIVQPVIDPSDVVQRGLSSPSGETAVVDLFGRQPQKFNTALGNGR